MLSSRSLKAVILGCAVLIGGCDRESADKAQPQASEAATAPTKELTGTIDRSKRGSHLPDLTFSDPTGKTLALASLKGKPLLINLWATWCAPCVAELPTLDKLAADRAGNLKVLTISQDLGQPQRVGEFLAQRGVKNLEPWLDPDNALAMQYDVQTLPTTIYYDAEGREVWRFVGGHDWSGAETAKMLAETVSN
ncbi:TlpA disulfide reductase family protein [Novosphingobium sp.]|uniref:TlpA family protein disulfide reductase n=1 Tax=Novosphingobium sp. TaxID=1874826 RepID=UPI0027361F4B|nr:TlpA disulfide reductase family protein [Novosphingobium sp.]MDP3908109.1 TlpA disulfide reductase family protein [Novosphingobium sp.]